MRKFMFSVLLAIWAMFATGQGAVSVEATGGGSITFTPSGVIRTAPPAALKKSSLSRAVPAPVGKTKAINDTTTLASYTFTSLNINEVRMLFNAYRGIKDDENAKAGDIAIYEALRKFIVDNRGVANSPKRLTVTIPADKVERIFWATGGGYNRKSELQKELAELNRLEGLFNQADAQEKAAGVNSFNSKIEPHRYKFQ